MELLNRYKIESGRGYFQVYHIDINDLNDVEILERRRNLSKGELSSMVFAKRTQQAFLTDDQGARKLASNYMDNKMVQTTPHLLGWLIYSRFLVDSDVDPIIQEHVTLGRPLAPHFKKAYYRALECKLAHESCDGPDL
ncbi:MAG: hypothetical protein WAW37_18185 [Syntrophobacteraceae bacterium]